MSDENKNLPGRFAVYGAVAGKPAVVARFEDNDVWLTQKQLATCSIRRNNLSVII